MAKNSRTSRARSAAASASSNPYLRRIVEDEDLRDSVVTAFDAARDAYERLSSNGSVIDTAIDDKKVHKDLKTAAENLRDASNRLRGQQKKRRWGRILLIAVAGAVLALALSEDLRKAVLDALFGAEEEFEYTSTTTPAPAPTEA
jgi:NADH dehydrogenase/NADH:ubiquinone oxidoreductase subunit G